MCAHVYVYTLTFIHTHSSRGRRADSTPSTATTPTRSLGAVAAAAQANGQSDQPSNSLPPSILVVCYELLVTLNSFCCFDLESAQKLPQDLKVSVDAVFYDMCAIWCVLMVRLEQQDVHLIIM